MNVLRGESLIFKLRVITTDEAVVAVKRSQERYQLTSRLLRVVLIVSLGTLFLAWWQKTKLPNASEISELLHKSPVQHKTAERPFLFDYMGKSYLVEPVAEYELWGLVVSHNNPQGIADIYHDKTSVDIKDLCVIWGENVKGELYKQIEFSSNTWTCSVRMDSQAVHRRFRADQLSNNHLLSDLEEVRKRIQNVAIGDQIRLKGLLVNYVNAADVRMRRDTSKVRSDTGNGACEIVFVDELETIANGNPFWHTLFSLSRLACAVSLVLLIALFLRSAYART